ncbi:2-dehydropantoate 2-reductase [Streptomyces sp. YIM 130001]|uniref:ketopantoate reductase family protein n=1 Tax=Streptomyces sp. YIM 130001 TaxID=2259644 RepID=UPI000E6583C9|nr:2-dehydropantoate 2-reductase [Streptomyces sp. YIM 130001]RII18333.1 2-dehydropantoate 2-reductase [Streptomyces sp. YIM 130001]
MTTTSAPWTVAVLGPGGVGGLAAGLLARAGHRVICLAREETAAVLGSRELTVRSGQFGDFEVPVDADTVLRERVDAVLVTPKETGLRSALERVPRAVLGDALVVPLLNGVEHVDVLRAVYPAEQVVAATIRVESTRTAPGVIEHASPFAMVELAGATAPAERVARLGEVLREAGFAARVREDETAMLWGKMSFLLPLALLSTRYGLTVGELRDERRDDMLAVVDELARVAAAEGVEIDTHALIGQVDGAPYGMRSSMQKDAEAGRPLEVDAVGGALLRAADRHGIAVPVTSGLVTALSGS